MQFLAICCRCALSRARISSQIPCIIASRKFGTSPASKNAESVTTKFGNRGKLIYTGSTNTRVKIIKIFSFSTSAAAIGLQSMLMYKLFGAGSVAIASVVVSGICFGSFAIMTPLVLHFLVKRHVIEMYYNKDTQQFTSVTYNFVMRRRYFSFRSSDLDDRDASTGLATVLAKGQMPLLFSTNKEAFTDPEAYDSLMEHCHTIRKNIEMEKRSKDRMDDDDDMII